MTPEEAIHLQKHFIHLQDDTTSSQRSEVFMVTDLDGIPIDVSEQQNSAQSSQRSEDVKRWLQVKKENKAIRDHIQ